MGLAIGNLISPVAWRPPSWWQPLKQYSPLLLLVAGEECYTDAAKTTRAGDTDAVYVWGDLSGNGNDAVQATGGNRPLLSVANGVDFEASSSHWMSLAGLTSASTDYTLVVVMTPDTAAGTQQVLGAAGTGEAFTAVVGGSVALHDGTGSLAGMVATTRSQVLAMRVNATGTVVDFYREGSALAQSTSYDAALSWGATPALGAAHGGGAEYLDGAVKAVVLIDSALSDADLAAVHAVLMGNHGIAFSPLSVGNLEFWYTIAEDYMVLSGSDVTQLTDRSGNGRHMTVPGGESAPSYAAGVMTLDGGNNEALQVASWSRVQPCTNLAWLRTTTAGTLDSVWDGTAATSGRLYDNTSANAIINAGSVLLLPGSDLSLWSRVAAVYDGASSSLAIDDGTPATGDAGAGNPGGFTLGARGDLVGNGSSQFKGHIIGYSEALSAEALTALDEYQQAA